MDMPQPKGDVIAQKATLLKAFAQILPESAIISDPLETRAYECDALSAYQCRPLCVVLPENTEQVSEILKICHARLVPVVARGAGTSLSGGALPTADAVVIGVSRMNNVLEIDDTNRFIHVQTGMTNLSVSDKVSERGFFYAPDPSSQLACAIAGNIGMNSGGAHCLKYGVTTNNLMGCTIVLMDGTIAQIGGGYLGADDLNILGVICGSEGQLGIVTEAWLKILPKPEGARPALIGFSSSEEAGRFVSDVIKAGILPVAIEYMDRLCIEVCEKFCAAGYPDCAALLIIEVEGSEEEIDFQLGLIREVSAHHAPSVFRQSGSPEESERIWRGRKSAFGAIGQIGDYMCLDGTIPVSELSEVLGAIETLSAAFGFRVGNVFHAGDGNLHPLIIYDANKAGDLERCEALGAEILKLCVEKGGCLSGEHGIGVEKRELMRAQFSDDDIEMQMLVKDVFDPKWLLNPAKVFPLALSASRRGGMKGAKV